MYGQLLLGSEIHVHDETQSRPDELELVLYSVSDYVSWWADDLWAGWKMHDYIL